MSKDLAKSGIDYIIEHSQDNKTLYFGFYGGEPLLEFNLIKWCIDYINQNSNGKTVYYNITTNASLLTPEITNFLVKNRVMLLISLDGPQHIHDQKRKLASTGAGTFKAVINNIKYIYNTYPTYYEESVGFNVVLHGNNYNEIKEFFDKDPLFRKNSIQSTFITDNYCLHQNAIKDSVIHEKRYDLFLKMLANSECNDNMITSKLADSDFYKIGTMEDFLLRRKHLPDTCHRAGVCIPGIHKLFLSANGRFYPCERVSEASEVCCIGNIKTGLDKNKIEDLLNLERITKNDCKDCWAASFCTICLAGLENQTGISKEEILTRCDGVRKATDLWMKNYCVLKKLGTNLSNAQDDYVDITSPQELIELVVNDNDNKIYKLDKPICFIGESVEGLNISDDLALIANEITSLGYQLETIDSDILTAIERQVNDKQTCNNFEFISSINHYIKAICEKESSPDLIIVKIPGGIERSVNGVNNKFGLWYYIMSIAATPDCAILKLPFDEYEQAHLDEYKITCEQKFSIYPNFFIIGESRFCFDDTERDQENNFLTLDEKMVKNIINVNTLNNCYCSSDVTEMKLLAQELITLLESFDNYNGAAI